MPATLFLSHTFRAVLGQENPEIINKAFCGHFYLKGQYFGTSRGTKWQGFEKTQWRYLSDDMVEWQQRDAAGSEVLQWNGTCFLEFRDASEFSVRQPMRDDGTWTEHSVL